MSTVGWICRFCETQNDSTAAACDVCEQPYSASAIEQETLSEVAAIHEGFNWLDATVEISRKEYLRMKSDGSLLRIVCEPFIRDSDDVLLMNPRKYRLAAKAIQKLDQRTDGLSRMLVRASMRWVIGQHRSTWSTVILRPAVERCISALQTGNHSARMALAVIGLCSALTDDYEKELESKISDELRPPTYHAVFDLLSRVVDSAMRGHFDLERYQRESTYSVNPERFFEHDDATVTVPLLSYWWELRAASTIWSLLSDPASYQDPMREDVLRAVNLLAMKAHNHWNSSAKSNLLILGIALIARGGKKLDGWFWGDVDSWRDEEYFAKELKDVIKGFGFGIPLGSDYHLVHDLAGSISDLFGRGSNRRELDSFFSAIYRKTVASP